MVTNQLEVRMESPWYLKAYLRSVVLFARTLSLEPNPDVIVAIFVRHVRLYIGTRRIK